MVSAIPLRFPADPHPRSARNHALSVGSIPRRAPASSSLHVEARFVGRPCVCHATELPVCSFPLITRTASDSKISTELEFATPLEFPIPNALFRVPEPAKMARMISVVYFTTTPIRGKGTVASSLVTTLLLVDELSD